MESNENIVHATSNDTSADAVQPNALLLQYKLECLEALMEIARNPRDKRRMQAISMICRMPYLHEDGSTAGRSGGRIPFDVNRHAPQAPRHLKPATTPMEAPIRYGELREIVITTLDADSEQALTTVTSHTR
ncbi:MAG: hypothetical protein HC837_10595 [Chloroflexaceae bacterium]|nr:hypothetical protein [Chloroflexaceae bacterium]